MNYVILEKYNDLEKARIAGRPSLSGLVKRKVTIKGPRGTYEAYRWVKPGEDVKGQGRKKPSALLEQPKAKGIKGEGKPKADVGHTIKFEGKEYTVTATGKHGVTARDAKGNRVNVDWEQVKKVAKKDYGKESDEGGAGPGPSHAKPATPAPATEAGKKKEGKFVEIGDAGAMFRLRENQNLDDATIEKLMRLDWKNTWIEQLDKKGADKIIKEGKRPPKGEGAGRGEKPGYGKIQEGRMSERAAAADQAADEEAKPESTKPEPETEKPEESKEEAPKAPKAEAPAGEQPERVEVTVGEEVETPDGGTAKVTASGSQGVTAREPDGTKHEIPFNEAKKKEGEEKESPTFPKKGRVVEPPDADKYVKESIKGPQDVKQETKPKGTSRDMEAVKGTIRKVIDKIKNWNTKKDNTAANRKAVYHALKGLIADLQTKEQSQKPKKEETPKGLTDEEYRGLRKKGHSPEAIKKMGIHAAKAVYWS